MEVPNNLDEVNVDVRLYSFVLAPFRGGRVHRFYRGWFLVADECIVFLTAIVMHSKHVYLGKEIQTMTMWSIYFMDQDAHDAFNSSRLLYSRVLLMQVFFNLILPSLEQHGAKLTIVVGKVACIDPMPKPFNIFKIYRPKASASPIMKEMDAKGQLNKQQPRSVMGMLKTACSSRLSLHPLLREKIKLAISV